MSTKRLFAGPKVAIIMGSQSDYETMVETEIHLKQFGVVFETFIVSAHRTPKRLYQFCADAEKKGFSLIIAGAGGAAHLPGMAAALSALPVLGVPVESRTLKGLDSLLSIAQMPAGIPVGTLAVGKAGAINAALLAVSILARDNPVLLKKYKSFRAHQTDAIALKPKQKSVR
ncbi:MAG: 5-(carboxyamino)imidazole ribonucleotide mutase [Verrucomicrobiota bacterium]|nr:5-(carboxyamino)imidazole ribonucleotide mutase [Verrucomicrobiota bacterium]